MTAHDAFLRALAAGDPHSARARRMLKAATTLAQEILP